MKVFKKLTSVFLSFMMIIGTLFSYGVSNNVAYAVEGDDSTLALPVKIYDAHMDGFVFEYKNSNVFGDNGSKNVTKGLVEDTLTDGKMVYRDTATSKKDAGLKTLASNIQKELQSRYNSQNHPYPNLYYALKGKLGTPNTVGNSINEKIKSTHKFDDIQTCYDAAYWMTYYMFRDGGEFSGTYNNKTYTGVLTKNFDIYDKLVLNKQDDGSYSFSATRFNESVLYDTTNKLIKNADEASGAQRRGGLFPLNDLGFADPKNTNSNQEKYDNKNYAYTLESSGKFVYNKKENLHFDFRGDDDVYLFINKKLALDIGGQHEEIKDSVYLEQECTASDASTGQTWAEYLGLEEGNIYDFNFFYIERHTTYANMEIKTNIHVYDPEAVPQKKAYVGNTEIPFGGYVSQGDLITYEFVLTNNGSANITNIEFKDEKLGVNLSKDTISLGSSTQLSDLTAKVGNITYANLTEDKLKSILANGIKIGETISIKGFKHTLTETDKFENILKFKVQAGDKEKEGYTTHEVVPVAGSDKAFIVDFGKPVTYSYNKVFDTVAGSTSHDVTLNNGKGIYGTMINNISDSSITYKLTKFMEGIDTFIFDEEIKKKQDDDKEIVFNRQTKVKMVPGTSIYYEDNFASSGIDDTSGNNTADGNNGIKYSSNWELVDVTEVSEVKGDGNIGYDSNYEGNALKHSGTMHKVTSTNKLETANFTFKGTGVDIYSYTDAATGKVSMKVYEQNADGSYPAKPVFIKTFDTKYNSGEAYQLPVIKFNSGKTTPSRYKVTLTIPKKSTFYLDGIRIYNPIGNNDTNYKEEVGSSYVSIRDESLKLKEDAKFTVSGNVFIDKYLSTNAHSVAIGEGKDLTEYTNYGRKTEVVVAPGQTITITLKNSNQYLSSKDGTYKTQIGARINAEAPESVMKSLSQEEKEQLDGKVYVNGNDIKLNSSTDMYYDVVSTDKTITIKNNSYKLISLTNLKLK